MPNGPKFYLVLDTGNRYSPSMTLRFIKTSPFKYLNVFDILSAFQIDYGIWEVINGTLAFLLYVNFLVDPVIYFVRIKQVRRGLEMGWNWMIPRIRLRCEACLHRNNRTSSATIEEYEMRVRHKLTLDQCDLQSSSTPMNFNDVCFRAF